ncbi:MAG: hypothetical protein QM687_06320 [Ferruginibacter sp.]
MAQEIGTEIKIKAGETVSSGRLKITYVGVLREEMRAQNLNLENIESFFFEITDSDKIYKRKANDMIVINELVIKIIKEKSDSSAATVIVRNEIMAKRSLESDIIKSIESYENAKAAFERLAELMGEPAPDSIVVSLSASDEKMYFTFSNANPNPVSLNGVELRGEIGMYWIKPGLLKKTNLLMLYYRGECYKYSFGIASGNEQKPQSFIMPKVTGKKIRWDYNKKRDSN